MSELSGFVIEAHRALKPGGGLFMNCGWPNPRLPPMLGPSCPVKPMISGGDGLFATCRAHGPWHPLLGRLSKHYLDPVFETVDGRGIPSIWTPAGVDADARPSLPLPFSSGSLRIEPSVRGAIPRF